MGFWNFMSSSNFCQQNTSRIFNENPVGKAADFAYLMYSEASNKHGVFLILFEKIFTTTCLIKVWIFREGHKI